MGLAMAAADGTHEDGAVLPDAEPLYRFPDAGSDGSSSSDDGEEWSIPDSAVTFTRDGWERYCQAAAEEAAGEGTETERKEREAEPTASPAAKKEPVAAEGALPAPGRSWRLPRVQAAAAAPLAPLQLDTTAVAARVAGLSLPAPPWASELASVDALLLASVAARKHRDAASAAGPE